MSVQYRALRRDGDMISWENIEGSFGDDDYPGWLGVEEIWVGSWDGQIAVYPRKASPGG